MALRVRGEVTGRVPRNGPRCGSVRFVVRIWDSSTGSTDKESTAAVQRPRLPVHLRTKPTIFGNS